MLLMILKMSTLTGLYVLLTVLIWKWRANRPATLGFRLVTGIIYGLCAVLSTHYGVDYGHMLLNVRDIGPLAAGLFFDPLAGILAGLIGGIERYIVGTYFGIGSYTRIACSVSTCLAGFLAAFLNICIFKRKKPSAIYAFFMGAVMEVFHMYVVLITHRADMKMAFYVVSICSGPMIIFTGIGLAAASCALRILSGEWRNPLRRVREEEVPVSQRFQRWLFAVTTAILVISFLFSYAIQTQSAIQSARETLAAVSGDIRETYLRIESTRAGVESLSVATAEEDARIIAEMIRNAGGAEAVDATFLERMRETCGLEAVTIVNRDGTAVLSAGKSPVYAALLEDVLSGAAQSGSARFSGTRVVAGAGIEGGMLQTVLNPEKLADTLNMSGLDDALSLFHVGSEGTFDIIRDTYIVMAGDHRGRTLSQQIAALVKDAPLEACFSARLFNQDCFCRVERLDDSTTLLTSLPLSEVYASRNSQAYESAFADILLFTVIYVLISLLVQQIVVKNLDLVNASLARITGGDLNEVVSVRKSSEFASLSDDINQTVSVLKGYIDAAEKRIEQELEFARTIQDSALPKNFAFPRGDFEIFATMDPAKEVGGDFYDFFFVDSNRLALVIADVSGKGIPAALFMMRGKTAIRSLAETVNAPEEILYRANLALCEGNEAEMFVTVWIGIIDLTTGVMRCANAGHEYPALMRAGGDYALLKDRHGLALAAMEGARYKSYEIQFNPGDRLFVYTDGVPEAIDGQLVQYGCDRMVQKLNALREQSMEDTLRAVREDISAFAGDTDQFDDITMLGFIYCGETPIAAPEAAQET